MVIFRPSCRCARSNWSRNAEIFADVGYAFKVTFVNRCDELERPVVAEYYQRCFGVELPGTVSAINPDVADH